jgi:hypothetical protein
MQSGTSSDLAIAETVIERGAGRSHDVTRRQFFGGTGKLAAASLLTFAVASVFPASEAAAVSGTGKKNRVTPEIKLIDDYSSWFFGTIGGPIDIAKIRTVMPDYITNETILHEAPSLPWGGTTVGYDGWVRLCQISATISERLGSLLEASQAQYWQSGNVVFRESALTVKPTKAAPTPFVTLLLERHTIESARIKQIDGYFQDTDGFLERLKVLGIYSGHRGDKSI